MQQAGSRVWTAAKPLLPYAFLALLVLLVLAGVSPHWQPLPSTDSSVFLYTAETILDGGLPYRDVWDHKGPLIYYIDALGLSIADGSRWGVWLLELIFVTGAAWLGYRLLSEVFGRPAALFASVAWVLMLAPVLDLGNLTEEYGLLFQFGALWFFWRALKQPENHHFWWVGLMGACAFLLRPNLIGVSAGIAIVVGLRYLQQRKASKLGPLLQMAGGFLIPIELVVLYFAINGALPDLWDQVFHYNFVYSDTSWNKRGEVILYGIERLAVLGLLAVTGWVTALTSGQQLAPTTALGAFQQAALWIFPLELLLVSLPGNQFPHYLMTLLPIFALFCAALLNTLIGGMPPARQRILVASFLGAFLFVPLNTMWAPLRSMVSSAMANGGRPVVDVSTEQGLTQAIDYLRDNAEPGQPVLFLGNHVAISWFTDHPSPTRYVYQTPLFDEDYLRTEMADEFLADIVSTQPVIIDTFRDRDLLAEIDLYVAGAPQAMQPFYEYFQDYYAFDEQLSLTGWRAYQFVGEK